MSLFNGMKDKLGFGSKPEWQDDGYDDDQEAGYGYDDAGYDGSYAADDDAEGYDDGYADASSGSSSHSVVSFDAYNPSNFDNVKISSENTPRVASYDNLGSSRHSGGARGGYSGSSRGTSPGGRGSGTRSSSSRGRSGSSAEAAGASSWSAPSDPAFLDQKSPARERDIMDEIHAADPYSSLGSDFLNASKDPASHLSIVTPTAYADVEKIANAAKAGKSVVLVVSDTKPALAKRILDFSFGVASALNMNVDKAADRVFVISVGAEMLTQAERDYLTEQGVLG